MQKHTHAVLLVLFVLVGASLAQSSCYAAPSEPGDRRTDKSVLTVATYNPEWLFLSNAEDPSSCPELGCIYNTLEEALAHVKAVAGEIKKLNVDILNLIEVEGCEVLDVLLDYIGEEYGYARYLIKGTDTYTGQNVALLTRIDPLIDLQRTDEHVFYPISNTTCTGTIESEDYGVSKNYYTKFNVTGTIFNMFSVHFLSQPDNMERCFKREAQATVMADYMKESVKAGEKVIILGDMNDFDSTLVDINDDVPISNVMYILSNPFPLLFGGKPLFNVGKTVPFQEQRFSNWYDRNEDCTVSKNELSVIDHTLIDASLQSTEFSHARFVHSYAPTCDSAISDHYPVFSQFSLSIEE